MLANEQNPDPNNTFVPEPEEKKDEVVEAEVEPEKKEEVEKPVEDEAKKEEKSAVQKRIDFLVWEKKQAQQERDRLITLLEKTVPQKEKVETEKEPTEFKDLESYTDYIVQQKIDAKLKDLDAKMAQREQQTELQGKVESFKSKTETFIKTNPDFYDKINDPSLPTSETIQMSIVESEKGPEIAYYLAENPAELNRIVKLSPYGQAMALGKIEATFNEKPPAKVSNAPDPLGTLKGSGGKASDAPSDKDSIEVWMKKERARMDAKARR